MGTLFLRRLTRWQAETEREQIVDLRIAAHQESHPEAAPPDRAELLRAFIDQDVQRPDFDLVLAGDPRPAGCAYGFRAEPDDSWWSGFRERPDELPALAGTRTVFVVATLVVHPRRRRQGLAGRLQRELLSRAGAPLALALLTPDNGQGQATAQALGWSKAGQLTPRDGVPLDAWSVPLGQRG
ncbi:GNAT family N-acetyltransferase [Streptomyces sp. DSM 44915]|uniref:GNAT family N-acetyltransferase n=1 Tax=Streptomyces chisholmiae TaxID=3075540 RepID=A0ABU2JKX4_9ACTN|nr:GNAT family N-acetyltransferase [Streptomyces sp. DSM 44915]MDT0265637.1 GNAT family N-acetyltransferase [Streptomyces sp. DSM 44915]